MKKYSRELLQKRYLSLPKDLRENVFAVKTADKIREVAQKYEISNQKICHLASITGDVLLGVLPLEKFSNALELRLAINKMAAQAIVEEIKREIFLPVWTSFKKAQESPMEAPSHPLVMPAPKPKKEIKKLEKTKPEKLKPKELKPELTPPPPMKKERFSQGTLPAYKGKISPYEKKREIGPRPIISKKTAVPIISEIIASPKTEESVSKKSFQAVTPKIIPVPKVKQVATEKPPRIEGLNDYQIRTMKKDIEKAKKKSISPKPETKVVKDNLVDLSGK